jgi:hypothetical protein
MWMRIELNHARQKKPGIFLRERDVDSLLESSPDGGVQDPRDVGRTYTVRRWNSGTAILVEVAGHKLESSQTRVLSGFLPSFFRPTKCCS